MAKMSIEQVKPEEMAQMHANLLLFLQENGYQFVEKSDCFEVVVPRLRLVEKSALEVPKANLNPLGK